MNGNNNVFFVDLLLPQYDISAGSNFYDDVLAAEFCIGIANRLEGRSAIYVKDKNSLTTIQRILESRESAQVKYIEEDEYEEVEVEIEVEEDEYDNENNNNDDDEIQVSETPPTSIEFYDDFADFSGASDSVLDRSEIPVSPPIGIDNKPPTNTGLDVIAFREQLMSTWDTDGNPSSSAPRDTLRKKKATKTIIKRIKKEKLNPAAIDSVTKSYRLTSMFGDSPISKGTDMSDDIISALRVNARPLPDEDTMIILSAISREECIALQSLVVSFQSSKTIVLVNCKVDQLPRELSKVETVYSVLPLVAKGDGKNIGPKLVVLRQYPGNWQVHVDADGQGFQLATQSPADYFPKRGPPMEWIAKCLKNFLQSRLG